MTLVLIMCSLLLAQDDAWKSPSSVVADVIVDPGPEFDDAKRLWQGIPGIERAKNGRMWATWYSGDLGEGDPGNYVLLASKGPIDSAWSKPSVVIQSDQARMNDPLLWIDPDGRLWGIYYQLDLKLKRGGTYAIRCDDPTVANPSWSKPIWMGGGIVFGKPIVLKSGEWLAPISIPGSGAWKKLVGDTETGCVVSTDRGETWQWRGGAAVPTEVRNWDEHCIVEKSDGSLYTLIRTTNGLYHSASADQGRTWTAAAESGVKGPTSRACLRKLQSGSWVLVYHDSVRKREKLTAFLSTDEGKSWSKKLLLDERNSVSYPDATEGPDGRIYVAYDLDRYVAPNKAIYVTSFLESDFANAGSFDAAAQREVVSKAAGSGNKRELNPPQKKKK